jgi:hypothetical protein
MRFLRYADAIATNDARGVLGRVVVALVVLPLAMFAGLTQMALYYTVRAASACLPACRPACLPACLPG